MEIIDVYKEFKGLKNYCEKLKFFDKYFTLLPFSFPPFDVQLNFLLKEDGINSLTEILEKERRKGPRFTKTVFYNEMKFVFDAHPHNSNVHIFNDYIISKFTCSDGFSGKMFNIVALSAAGKTNLEILIVEVNNLIETVKQKIGNRKDRTLQNQFFNVFYAGFIDYTNQQVKNYYHKKKLIELYLYSTGILFGMYKQALSEQFCRVEKEFNTKISLLHDLGVTDFLRNRYKNLGETNIERKIAEIYSAITGKTGV